VTTIARSVNMGIAHTVSIAGLGISITLVVGCVSVVRVARPGVTSVATIARSVNMGIAHTVSIARLGISVTLVVG